MLLDFCSFVFEPFLLLFFNSLGMCPVFWWDSITFNYPSPYRNWILLSLNSKTRNVLNLYLYFVQWILVEVKLSQELKIETFSVTSVCPWELWYVWFEAQSLQRSEYRHTWVKPCAHNSHISDDIFTVLKAIFF